MPSAANPLKALSEDTHETMNQVFSWFNSNVAKLESAYRDMGFRFDQISLELDEKNKQIIQLFLDNEAIQTQLKAVLSSIHSGVVMVSTEGKVLVFNREAEEIFGLSSTSVLGENVQRALPGPFEGTHFILETLVQHREYSNLEAYWKRGEEIIPLGYSTSIVKDPKGSLLGAVAIFNDLSELKGMQRQVQNAKTLAAIGEMAATVAHEIRNPLGAIGGFAGLLQRDLAEEDARRGLVGKIVQGVSSLNKIVSNLLVFSKPMDLQLKKVEFNSWLDDIFRFAEIEIQRLQKKIDLQKNYEIKGIWLYIDPEKFQQVLLNLTFNAIQAISKKGEIVVSLSQSDRGRVRLGIRDSGAGIEAEHLPRIFDPFFTTKEQGTGLGLAIVKRIVNLHGGEILVRSQKGKFTEFLLTLKREAGEPE